MRRFVCVQLCCIKLLIEKQFLFLPHRSHVVSAAAWGCTTISYAKRAAPFHPSLFLFICLSLCHSVSVFFLSRLDLPLPQSLSVRFVSLHLLKGFAHLKWLMVRVNGILGYLASRFTLLFIFILYYFIFLFNN